jgi:hypothetical protein
MIAKIGFVTLVLISCGSLFLLDYYIKQDQEENSKQLHNFVQQNHEKEKKQTFERRRFELQLTTNFTYCSENARKTYNAYIQLIQKAAPIKHGETVISKEILDEAATLLVEEKARCKKVYDNRMQEGF